MFQIRWPWHRGERGKLAPSVWRLPEREPVSLPVPLVDRPARYLLVRKLGAGGRGVVYLASDETAGGQIALKRPVYRANGCDLARFQQEAEFTVRVQHANVVRILGVGNDFASSTRGEFPYDERAAIPFFIMEYISGVNLEVELAGGTALPWPRARAIALQICDALAAVHMQGIVHRDVKPSNVLWVPHQERGEQVKLIDFGIAWHPILEKDPHLAWVELEGTIGSPAYMAPEQIIGNRPDSRMDIYSLGVLLFQMVSNRLPFDGSDREKVWGAHLESPIPHLPAEMAVPVSLDRILQRALAKKPDDRYPTILEMKREIEACG